MSASPPREIAFRTRPRTMWIRGRRGSPRGRCAGRIQQGAIDSVCSRLFNLSNT
ncbi:MAG: hypothetical protein MZV64_29060 [Ignavibacteriales bacterium]|nr:hypothetical protein [Ignavibacteriales bacterium]